MCHSGHKQDSEAGLGSVGNVGTPGPAKQSRLYRSDWKWMSPIRRSTGKQECTEAEVLKAGVMSAGAGGCRQTNITSVP